MRAGFVAGALMALMDRGWTDFDAAVAVSASVPTLAYFAAGQRGDLEAVWRRELCSPDLVCYRNLPAASLTLSAHHPVVDIDYLVDRVFRERHPLDLGAFRSNPMQCRFAATRVPAGTLALLDPHEHDDVYALMKACLAVPGCYPGTVCVNACEYLDGGTVNPLPLFEEPPKEGDRLVAILSKPAGCEVHLMGAWEKLLFWRYFHRHPWMEEKLLQAERSYQDQVAFLEEASHTRPQETFAVFPDEKPPAPFLTRNERRLNATIDMGYRKIEELEHELAPFFRPAPDAPDGPPDDPARTPEEGRNVA
jgi:predicted patatin/cPLA2 family phospholipase